MHVYSFAHIQRLHAARHQARAHRLLAQATPGACVPDRFTGLLTVAGAKLMAEREAARLQERRFLRAAARQADPVTQTCLDALLDATLVL